MEKNLTEIIFLLDRSGSMAGFEDDTIGGFNALIKKQCQLEGETLLTTVLFDDQYEILWNGIDANNVKLTKTAYFVRGCTALLDAVGRTILDVDTRLSVTDLEKRPDNVIFVVTTDGMENASREFTYANIKELIGRQQEKYNWEFIFMGANIDVAKEADDIGIKAEDAFDYEPSESGVKSMYLRVHEELLDRRKN